MTPALQLEMQAIRDQMISRQVFVEYKQAKRNAQKAYAEVAPAAVPADKRKLAADLLAKLAKSYAGHRPRISWFQRLRGKERDLVRSGEYPFRYVLDENGVLGYSVKSKHEIGLSVELDGDELEFTLRHEYAHSLGISDESDADQFAHQEAA